MIKDADFIVEEDRTFHEVSMYGSLDWTATALGITKDVFFRKRAKWEKEQAFPKPDPINKMYIKADVEAWVARRRRVADSVTQDATFHGSETTGINLHVL